MRSSNGHLYRLAVVAILSVVVLAVASSQAAPPTARPSVTIDGRLPQAPAHTPPTKPFENYVRPSPVSPYMQLFRGDNAGGTIDNYSTFVKPLLLQQQMNRELMRNRSQLNAMGPALQQKPKQRPGFAAPYTVFEPANADAGRARPLVPLVPQAHPGSHGAHGSPRKPIHELRPALWAAGIPLAGNASAAYSFDVRSLRVLPAGSALLADQASHAFLAASQAIVPAASPRRFSR